MLLFYYYAVPPKPARGVVTRADRPRITDVGYPRMDRTLAGQIRSDAHEWWSCTRRLFTFHPPCGPPLPDRKKERTTIVTAKKRRFRVS